MGSSLSIFGLLAIALYAVVALCCMAACGTAATSGQPPWNRKTWAVLGLLFVLLIVLRGFGVEELVRDAMRDALRGGGNYAERRSAQGIIASVALAAVGAAGFWWLYKVTRNLRGRRNIASVVALASGGLMVFLVLLRMISLHIIDRALYGPLKLNWIGDIGTSLVVLAAAIYYLRLVRARP